MSLKTKDIRIESTNYTLIEIGAYKRSIIALELKHIAAGAKDGIKNIDSKVDYAQMVAGILERVTPEKGASLLRTIIIEGLQFPIMDIDKYDEHFGEFYEHQIDLVAEIMAMNFGKVIDNIKKKLEKTGILTKISSLVEESEQT